ncbi:MAG TPA: hypothetical protein VKQ70_17515 [Caulobacteraceae bacterium]|jgi:hypothetical protein|nr:hypothetical protein [Caulobacteraceae bacterium]
MTHPTLGLPGIAPDAPINPLIFDLLEWLAISPRAYSEAMEVWRTSCPRLTIWEDAVDLGYVARRRDESASRPIVFLTATGRQALDRRARS